MASCSCSLLLARDVLLAGDALPRASASSPRPGTSAACRASLAPVSPLASRSGKLGLGSLPGLGFQTQRSRRPGVARAVLDPSHIDAALTTSSQITASTHNLLATLADAAGDAAAAAGAAAGDAAAAAGAAAAADDGGWFGGLANLLEGFLKILEQGLAAVHVPYPYGFSIILLTVIVKAATFPLTKKQVESTLAMQALAPKLKTIQAKYAGDQERIQLETARLYRTAGVNPLAGCLPTLATLPVWIGLYQALSNVAKEGVLTEGFFWIPSLAGPASLAARDDGSGTSWLFSWVNGAPPLGWADTAAYLVLPVLLVASQYYSMQLLQPATVSDDPAQKNTQLILKFLPIMIGWFSLSVPSGLSLYWFTNNVLSTAQTVYLRQMGGATPVVTAESAAEIIDVGQAKRTASPANVATEQDTDAARGERFRRLKQLEEEKKAARRAAEDAAREAALQAARERAQLKEQEAAAPAPSAAAPAPSAAATPADTGSESDKTHAEGEVVETTIKAAASAPALAANGSARPASKRSKRTRRAR